MQLFPKIPQIFLCFILCTLRCRCSGDHDDIPAPQKLLFLQPVSFSDQSGHTMPDNTVSDLFTDRDPEPVPICSVIQYIHDKLPRCGGCSLSVHLLKITVFFQTLGILHPNSSCCSATVPQYGKKRPQGSAVLFPCLLFLTRKLLFCLLRVWQPILSDRRSCSFFYGNHALWREICSSAEMSFS